MKLKVLFCLMSLSVIIACSKKKEDNSSKREVKLNQVKTKTLPVYGASTKNIKQSSFYLNKYDREEDFPAAYMALENTPVEDLTTKVIPEVFFSRARTVDGKSYVHRGAQVKVTKLKNTFDIDFLTMDMIKNYKLTVSGDELEFDQNVSDDLKEVSLSKNSLTYDYRKVREMGKKAEVMKSLSSLSAKETSNGVMWLVEKKIPLKNKTSFYSHAYIIKLEDGFDSILKTDLKKDLKVTISYKVLDSGIK